MSYLREFSPQVSQIVFLAQLTVLRLVTTVWVKTFKMSYSPGVECTDITKSCSQADLTVLRVITIVWTKTSKMSYISEFSVEVSQIVFSAHLTVLRLVTTVRVKTSKISYLREFSPQVSQIVFSAHLTVLRLVYNCMSKNFQNLISSWFQCTSITNRVLTSFDRFTAYYNCMS